MKILRALMRHVNGSKVQGKKVTPFLLTNVHLPQILFLDVVPPSAKLDTSSRPRVYPSRRVLPKMGMRRSQMGLKRAKTGSKRA